MLSEHEPRVRHNALVLPEREYDTSQINNKLLRVGGTRPTRSTNVRHLNERRPYDFVSSTVSAVRYNTEPKRGSYTVYGSESFKY